MVFDFIEKHKIAFVVILSIILGAAYMGITNGIKASRAAEREQAAEQAGRPQGGPREPEGSIEGLTDRQRSYVKGYGQEEQEIIDQLAAAPWREGDGRGTIRFSASGTFTETLPGESGGSNSAEKTSRSMAIAAIDGHPVGVPQDGSTSVTTFVGLMEDGTYEVFHLTRTQAPGSDTPNPILHLESDALGGTGSFTNRGAWEDLDIRGVGEEVADAVDGRTRELKACLTDYVAAYHSSCATAKWDETVSVNYAEGTVEVGFALTSTVLDSGGSPEESYVIVTYHMDTNTFEGSEA